MLKFAPEELTDEGLRKLADKYGIPKATKARDSLLAALKDRMAVGTEIAIAEPKRPWFRTASGLVSVIALFVSLGGWGMVYLTIQKDATQKVAVKKQQWQQIIIYKIIKEGTTKKPYTMSFGAIQDKYLSAATASNIVDISRDELQSHELDRILLQLIAQNLVYLTTDDLYAVQRSSTSLRAHRASIEEDARYAIIDYLALNGGKHTGTELYAALQKKTNLESDEFQAILHQLMVSGMVVPRGTKLWSITNAPDK